MWFCPYQQPIATRQHRQQWAGLLGSDQTALSVCHDVKAATFALTIQPINYLNHSADGLTLNVFRELQRIQNYSFNPHLHSSPCNVVHSYYFLLQSVSRVSACQRYCTCCSIPTVSQDERVIGKSCSPTGNPELCISVWVTNPFNSFHRITLANKCL